MQLIKKIIDKIKPTSFLKLGTLQSYLDKEIGLKSEDNLKKYDLILIDCKKNYKEFDLLYKMAIKILSTKGVIIINGGYPIYSAYQNESICGKVWFWVLSSGKNIRFFNDGEKGLVLVNNKKASKIQGINPDFIWFYKNIKPVKESELLNFVTPTIKKIKVDEIL